MEFLILFIFIMDKVRFFSIAMVSNFKLKNKYPVRGTGFNGLVGIGLFI